MSKRLEDSIANLGPDHVPEVLHDEQHSELSKLRERVAKLEKEIETLRNDARRSQGEE